MDVGHTYRLSGRLAIERHDPDAWIDVDWDYLEEQRATTATRIPPYLLTFEDAGDLVHTFDPMRDTWPSDTFQETAYIPDGATMHLISEHAQNRTVTLGEGVYVFRQIAPCRRQSARYPTSPPTDKPWMPS